MLFRHKPPRDFVDKFFAKHQITRQDNTYLWPAGESLDKIMTLNEIFDMFNYPEIKMKYTTFSSVCDGLAKRGFLTLSMIYMIIIIKLSHTQKKK